LADPAKTTEYRLAEPPFPADPKHFHPGTCDARIMIRPWKAAIMSVGNIGAYSNWWQWQSQATTGSNATTTASSASNSIANSGSPAATSNVSAFMQAFSADLEAMLTQLGSDSSSTTASATDTGTTASSTGQTASNQASDTVQHHHHRHGSCEDGPMDNAANRLVDEIGQTVQNGSLSSGQITQAASAFASDVMQALQSYGTAEPTTAGTSIVA
jgi:hypothetical protein